ncbi:transporter substrate-binding domain-containing protein [Leptolyngbya sp. FACHB-261]|uniref:transporter substrate-binding domain-containing protein n=1 Tax=Leptolyngbya sp. FACHB-261 TaxID=2692806 RepID=UPI001684E6A0|nr:transporter substrate-binding domain-containing protein [Leptolyngbya sp. FACHB-261]MBD2105003.1 transporter substrate-binding domain-containing protein [Leptolyngbya sp. FACHB-261]
MVLLWLVLAWSQPAIAADWATIQQRHQLTIAVKDNLRPLGFKDVSTGELVGFEIDLARYLAQELLGNAQGLKLLPVSNLERLPTLWSGEADLVIARLSVTGPRARLVDFSTPYYVDGTMLVTRQTSLTRLEDLTDQVIAVLEGSSTIAALQATLPQARLVAVNSYQAALEALEAGQAVVFAADASVLSGWMQEYPAYRQVGPLLSAETLSVAMPKGLASTELRVRVNRILEQARTQGWLQQRASAWGLP